ncbi:MAG: hypothetical protein AAFZ15_35000, partial [Bacteroidota bacterium]
QANFVHFCDTSLHFAVYQSYIFHDRKKTNPIFEFDTPENIYKVLNLNFEDTSLFGENNLCIFGEI